MSKLLVVDDEAQIRNIIRKYGEFEGYEIAEAVDGMDAIEKCRKDQFDLIIMDIMMPNLDGFSAVKRYVKRLLLRLLCFPRVEKSMIVFMVLKQGLMIMSLNLFHRKS